MSLHTWCWPQVIAVRAGQVVRLQEIRKGLDFNPFVGLKSTVQASDPVRRPGRPHSPAVPRRVA